MKKYLSGIIAFSLLMVVASTASASNTLLARYTLQGTPYLASGCAWKFESYSTPVGLYKEARLICAGALVATYDATRSPGMIVAREGYSAVQASGTGQANTYNYAIYRVVPSCAGSSQWSRGPWANLDQASTAMGYMKFYKSPACNSPCNYNIFGDQSGYYVVCK